MKKFVFVLLMLMAHSACAQVISGTVVVINRTEDQVVFAADSRVTMTNYIPPSLSGPTLSGPITTPPNDSYCKIRAFKHQVVFAAMGHPEQFERIGGPAILSAYDEARNAVNDAKAIAGEARLDEITNNWCGRMKHDWAILAGQHLLDIRDTARASNGELVGGIFAESSEKKIYIRAAHVTFNESALLAPIDCSPIELIWIPCGGKQISGGGHFEIAGNFCSARKADSAIKFRTPLKAANRDTELTAQLVEMTIDAYGKDGDVGGHVNEVTLSKDGRITWNSNFDCPENQD